MRLSAYLIKLVPLIGFVILSSAPLSLAQREQLIIWNVGQGQWLTWVHEGACTHFDMGGEYAPTQKIQKLCGQVKNSLYLSHSDWDHIRFINWGMRKLPDLCLHQPPKEKLVGKSRLILTLPPCQKSLKGVQEVPNPISSSIKNDLSRIFMLHSSASALLIPGDSTSQAEKFWAAHVNRSPPVRHLILGHHGSKTSTSLRLLSRMPHLTQAIASARKRRYGHPHPIIQKRLKMGGISMLSTEQWSHITLQL